jgi:O-antigen/teichoic acid export membrane protein
MFGNALSQIVGVVAASGLSLVTFVVLTRSLGATTFGAYATAIAILSIPAIVSDLGLSTTVLREISHRPASAPAAVQSSLVLRLAAGIACLAFVLPLAWILPLPGAARTAALAGVAGTVALILNAGLLPVLQAELRMHLAVVSNVAGRLVTLVGTVVALQAGRGLLAAMAAYALGNVLTLALNAWFARHALVRGGFRGGAYSRRLLGQSLAVGAASIAGSVYFRIDTLILGAIRSPREVGLYAAAYKFLDLAIVVASAVSVTVFPHLARLASRGEAFDGTAEHAVRLLLALGTCLSVLAFVDAPELVHLTSGTGFDGAVPALRLLAPAIVASCIVSFVPALLFALRRERSLLALNVFMIGVNVGLNLALAPRFGYEAVAAVTLACEVVWLVLSIALLDDRAVARAILDFAPQVAVAAAALAAVLVVAPGPWPLVAFAGSACYAIVLTALPGPGSQYARAAVTLVPRRPARIVREGS